MAPVSAGHKLPGSKNPRALRPGIGDMEIELKLGNEPTPEEPSEAEDPGAQQ